jgi:hypothetical protein
MEAIEFAKAQNPKDVLGELAFKFVTEGARQNKDGGVTYYGWHVFAIVPKASPERKWYPTLMTIRNVNTHSNIKYDNAKPGVALQFRKTSVGNWTIDGKKVDSLVGLCIHRMCACFLSIVKKKKDAGDLPDSKIVVPVQEGKIDPKTKRVDPKQLFDDPIIRIKIDFPRNETKGIDNDAPPTCPIYDIEKPRPKNQVKPGEPAFFIAEYKPSPLEEGQKPQYKNLAEIIKYGSAITGVIDFSTPTSSAMGISMGPRFNMIMVKRATGRAINVDDAFGDQLNDLVDSAAIIENPDDADVTGKSVKDDIKDTRVNTDDIGDVGGDGLDDEFV